MLSVISSLLSSSRCKIYSISRGSNDCYFLRFIFENNYFIFDKFLTKMLQRNFPIFKYGKAFCFPPLLLIVHFVQSIHYSCLGIFNGIDHKILSFCPLHLNFECPQNRCLMLLGSNIDIAGRNS